MLNDNWTYCGDGNNMPTKEGFYLCSLKKEVQAVDELAVIKCWYSETYNSFMNYGDLIDAWMPLPQRYTKL